MNTWTRPFEWNRVAAAPAGSRPASAAPQYFAFLSYSHQDSADADWLHKELERFRVPASLAGKLTSHGVIPKRLTPIFRDRHELAAAGDLGTEIREALEASHCLIVLCSPAAAGSKWTNNEIELFKRLHPDGCLIAAIVSGEPFASETKGKEAEECLPPALRRKYDRRGRPTARRAEPLAADLRDVGDGRRLGFLKIVAGMLGVGLDELVQRDQLRRQRRLAGITIGSIGGMIAASVLAVTAIDARDAARDQRRAAESLVGFMLGDLKDKLEPLGRLDVLDSVGARALAYYENQDTSELSDDALAQRSRALTLMGQVASTRGDMERALGFYRTALEGTAEALRRSPDDPQRIYDHAQNVFYVGDIARSRGDLARAETAMREYKRLALRLITIDSSNPKWQMEGIYADTNLGVLLSESGRYSEAAAVFENALSERERLSNAFPANEQYRKSLIEVLAWLSEAREREGRLDDALAQRDRQLALLQPLIAAANGDAAYKRQALVAYRAAGRLNSIQGDQAKASELLRSAIAIGDELAQAEPANTDWAALGAWSKFDLGRVMLSGGTSGESATLIRSGCDTASRLVAKDPSVVEWRLGLRSECVELRTRAALARGSTAEAYDESARLLDLTRSELQRTPSTDARLELAVAFLVRGLVDRSAGNRDSARLAFQRAAGAWPKVPDTAARLARKAVILHGAGREREASEIAGRLERMGYRDPIYLRDLRSVG